jgi:hypothetical protein
MSAQDRRIFNEIKYLKEHYNTINVNIENDLVELLLNDSKEKKYPKIKCIMKGLYPYHPPVIHIFINNNVETYLSTIRYTNFHRISTAMSIINTKYENKLFKNDCLCCDSILHNNNWVPTFTLEQIINEIMKYNYIKKQVRYLLDVNSIGKKYNFSRDIEILIFNYLF